MAWLERLRTQFSQFEQELARATKEVERDVMSAVREGLDHVREDLHQFALSLEAYGQAHPELIYAVLRRVQPIVVVKKFALVTRFVDVQEVLSRDDVFDVPYAERMRLITDDENFFLGMRDGPRYSRDRTNMMAVVRRQDVATIVEPLVSELARAIVEPAKGELDVVQELARPVPARMVASYFGVAGPSEGEMIDWTSALFRWLFLDQAGDPEVRESALASARGLCGYLDQTIKARREQPSGRVEARGSAREQPVEARGSAREQQDDVLGRCCALSGAGQPGMSDLDIRNNLLGLLIGAIPTTATCAALALDELLDRPEQLRGAHEAARSGNSELVGRYVLEALRFRPMNPGIFRIANQDFEVARGELRATRIPKGATVIAATQSAMFDAPHVPAPSEFRLDRSPREYMLWGHGLHTCFGEHINQVQIPRILEPLLAKPKLRRASGPEGKLTRQGPFAGSLRVQFG